jgi:tetratricopeptide (TPR) repeat protein
LKKLSLIIFLLSFGQYAKSQTIEEVFATADSFKSTGNYDQAILEYKRVIYFDDSAKYKYPAYESIASSYVLKGSFDDGIKNYELAISYSKTETQEQHSILNKARTLILMNSHNLAYSELLTLPDTLIDSLESRKNYLFGVCLFEREEYDKSLIRFKQSLHGDSNAIRLMDQLFGKTKSINKLSVRRARFLSTILPGLGQFVAGDIKSGLNSLVLNGLLVTGFVFVWQIYGPVQAMLGTFSWLQRYYFGGIKKAGLIAQTKQEQRKAALFKEIYTLMKNATLAK